MKRTLIQSIVAFAESAMLTAAYAAPHWYLSYGAGLARAEFNANTSINNNSGASAPYNRDIYTTNKTNNPAFLAEIGQSWEISTTGLKALSLGLQYQHYMTADIGGEITQYSSPAFLNYPYSLDLETNILMLNAKLELFSWKRITPFINIGGDLLQLIATNYTETRFFRRYC